MYNQTIMSETRRIGLLFVCCLILMLVGLFGVPGAILGAVIRATLPTFLDYLDFGAFLANGLFAVGAIIIWVVGCQRIRHPRKPSRPNGYESEGKTTTL